MSCINSRCDGSNAVTCGQADGVDITDLCGSEFFQDAPGMLHGVGADRRPICTFGLCTQNAGDRLQR